jgi:phage shock protein A
MRLFRRIGDMIGANLNDLADRFEDPEVMLRQAIREMDDTIVETTAAAARAIAGERLLAEQLAEHEREAGRWQARAEQAVGRAEDDLARKALVRRHEHDALRSALHDQWTAACEASRALRRQVVALKARRAEGARKLATLSARLKAAKACKTLQGLGPGPLFQPEGFARFARMQETVELAEAEARALIELHVGPGDELEAALEAREDERRIEAELAAIKETLRSRA